MKISLTVIFLFTLIIAKAQTIPANTGSAVNTQEALDALMLHNKVRKDVGTAALTWSSELATFAQAWANHLAKNCSFKHRPPNGEWAQQYGENLFYGTAKTLTASEASQAWYNEIKDYKYGKLNTQNWSKTGHYTQMVWNTTTQVGIGKASCPSGAIIIVANYNPRGNYLDQKPY
jgi:pathogenesis-related protein 1